jgi:hypothetical protein
MQASDTHADKTEWGPGPWMDEPDEERWVDEETGLDCLILRNRLGALCGYVGVSSSHPFHGLNFGMCPIRCGKNKCEHSPERRLEVHGGLTYSGAFQDALGRFTRSWWFGFDCTHPGDLAPSMLRYGATNNSTYRDRAFVEQEIRKLARQLVAMG